MGDSNNFIFTDMELENFDKIFENYDSNHILQVINELEDIAQNTENDPLNTLSPEEIEKLKEEFEQPFLPPNVGPEALVKEFEQSFLPSANVETEALTRESDSLWAIIFI